VTAEWDEGDDQEPDDDGDWEPDYDDPDDDWEPDPEDHEIAKAYEEHAEHCETVHGGGECDCRPSLRDRLAWEAADAARRFGNARDRAAIAMRGVYTVRLGRAEVTLRLNADRTCGACAGRGWFYTLSSAESNPIPTCCNGASLCGCGSATSSLAESRRDLRRMRDEPPF
jgi:hypothetical protein